MKIAVLKGSPNMNGSSNMLADNFISGATEAGHPSPMASAHIADNETTTDE